jgi:hypothetical protein
LSKPRSCEQRENSGKPQNVNAKNVAGKRKLA